MQLYLASFLSCAALLVGVLAQTDWKAYSLPESGIALLSDELRLFNGHSPFDAPLVTWMHDRREAADKSTEKTFNRGRDASIHPKETKLTTEPTALLARHNGRTFILTDSKGRAIEVDFDFSEHSFEMLGQGRGKDKAEKAKKFFSFVSEMAEREIRKEFGRAQREGRGERRQTQREMEDDTHRVDRADPVEARGGQPLEYMRGDRSERIDRSNQ